MIEVSTRMLARGEGPEDSAEVDSLFSSALAGSRLSEGVRRFREGPYFKREFSCVLVQSGTLLGCACFCPAILQGSGRAFKAALLLPIVGCQGSEREGMLERLARHGVQRAVCLGYETVVAMGPAQCFLGMDLVRPEALGIEASLPIPEEDALVFVARRELRDVVSGRLLLPPGMFTA